MRKERNTYTYYIAKTNLSDTYALYWAETDEQKKLAEERGFEKITYSAACQYCKAETNRRRYHKGSAGKSTNVIAPVDYAHIDDWRNDPTVYRRDYRIFYK